MQGQQRVAPPRDGAPGLGVDAHGGQVIDPTANVIALVNAEKEHNDKLRTNDEKWSALLHQTEKDCDKEKAELREKLAAAESRRIDANAIAEQRRVDALLQAGANAVALASTRAELTASALAERVDTSAKTLAAQQATQNDATATTINHLRTEIGDRLKTLEEARAQIGGRDEARAKTTDQSGLMRNFLIGIGVSIFLSLMGMVITIVLFLLRKP
jgi:hypothetical protein